MEKEYEKELLNSKKATQTSVWNYVNGSKEEEEVGGAGGALKMSSSAKMNQNLANGFLE